jgi:hypothetical protein
MSDTSESKQCRICEHILSADQFYHNRAICKSCIRARSSVKYRVSSRAVRCPNCSCNLSVIRYQKKNGALEESSEPTIEAVQVGSHWIGGSGSAESR